MQLTALTIELRMKFFSVGNSKLRNLDQGSLYSGNGIGNFSLNSEKKFNYGRVIQFFSSHQWKKLIISMNYDLARTFRDYTDS